MNATTPQREAGFNLIEVLVTLAILSVGFLGLAKLQVDLLRYTQSALMRSHAVFLASSILDGMRANRSQALAGADATCPYCTAIGTPQTAGTVCVGSVACTAAQMAAFDLDQWKSALASLLPSGDGSITRNGTTFSVVVQWDDSRGVKAPQQFTVSSDL